MSVSAPGNESLALFLGPLLTDQRSEGANLRLAASLFRFSRKNKKNLHISAEASLNSREEQIFYRILSFLMEVNDKKVPG